MRREHVTLVARLAFWAVAGPLMFLCIDRIVKPRPVLVLEGGMHGGYPVLSPDGKWLYTTTGLVNGIHHKDVWNVATGQRTALTGYIESNVFFVPGDKVRFAECSAQRGLGRFVVREMCLRTAKPQVLLEVTGARTDGTCRLACDGKFAVGLAEADGAAFVFIYDLDQQRFTFKMSAKHSTRVPPASARLTLSDSRDHLASVAAVRREGELTVWNARTGRVAWEGRHTSASRPRFIPGSELLPLPGAGYDPVPLVDCRTGKVVAEIPGPQESPSSDFAVATLPTGTNCYATCAKDQRLRLRQWSDHQEVRSWPVRGTEALSLDWHGFTQSLVCETVTMRDKPFYYDFAMAVGLKSWLNHNFPHRSYLEVFDFNSNRRSLLIESTATTPGYLGIFACAVAAQAPRIALCFPRSPTQRCHFEVWDLAISQWRPLWPWFGAVLVTLLALLHLQRAVRRKPSL